MVYNKAKQSDSASAVRLCVWSQAFIITHKRPSHTLRLKRAALENDMAIVLRNAVNSDARRIAEIHVAAWKRAYTDIMDAGFLESLSVDDREEMWRNVLSGSRKGCYLVAQLEEAVEGFCVFGPVRERKIENLGELVALNVHPECWGEGVGASLVTRALEVMKSDGYTSVCLSLIHI